LPLIVQITKSSEQNFHYIYAINILGSVVGSIITGYYMFEYFSIANNILILSLLTIGLSVFISFYYKHTIIIISIIIIPLAFHSSLYKNFLEKLQYYATSSPFEYVVENRHGIITVVKEDNDYTIYGDGVYDGRFNIKITKPENTNGIDRAYAISLLHKLPSETLVIGLSSGSWVKVLSDYSKVKKMDIIEINEGYKDIIKHFPAQASIFNNHKNNFYYDDAALWLKRNNNKYDFILMNTSFYWRSNTNNLLSKEFLELLKQHLNTNGVIYFNTTGCEDIFFTASHVFKHVTKIANFIAASDAPFNLNQFQKEDNFSKMLTLDLNDALVKAEINSLLNLKLKDVREEYLDPKKHYWLITRDNLANELKTDQHFYKPETTNKISQYFKKIKNQISLALDKN
jgi:spermidine synthase